MIELASDTDLLRARYRPPKVRVLFVGEAPPAGGTFFYRGDSQVFRYLREALQAHLGHPSDFLSAFAERGYFLDDLVIEPVDRIPLKARAPIYRENVQLLADRMVAYDPEMIITILMRICPYVQDARCRARLNVLHHCVPFPGTGQQANFRRRMAEIVPLLP